MLRSLMAGWGTTGRRTLLVEVGPVLIFLVALVAKLLYFVVVAYPPPGGWWHARWWLELAGEASLGSLGTALVAISPLFLVPPRRRLVLLWAGSLVVTLLILADVLYFRFFGDILSVPALAEAPQVGMISDSVVALLRPADAFFFTDLVLGLALLPWYLRRHRSAFPAYERPRRVAVLSLTTGLLLAAVPLSQVWQVGPVRYFAHLKVRGAARIGLLNYHLYDVGRHAYASATTPPVGPAERALASACLDEWRLVSDERSDMFGIARGKNLILLMVESLQGFPVGLRVNGAEITPHLNALARRSLTFENFYSQAWHGVTADGEFTSLQSLHPLREGAVPILLGGHHFRTLPHVLSERGYTTLAARGAGGAMWGASVIHPRYGFRHTYYFENFRNTERIGMGLTDKALFPQVTPLLETLREPFMAYLLTLSTHHPYRIPKGYQELDLGSIGGTKLRNYLQTVHYTDQALGEFIQRLDTTGLLDRSVLVVYGDHTANLGDPRDLETLLTRHAGYPKRRSPFDDRYWRAANELGFMIHLPHDAAAGRRPGGGGLLDIAPTALHLLGVEDPGMVMLGRDLTTEGRPFVVFRDGSFVAGDTLCIVGSASILTPQCRHTRTGVSVPVEGQRPRFEEARRRLAVSDILLHGDLIPWASAAPWRRAAPSGTSTSDARVATVGAQRPTTCRDLTPAHAAN